MVYGAPGAVGRVRCRCGARPDGNLGWSVTAALLLPAVTARVVRSDLARALLGGALCCGVLWLGGVGTPAAFAAVGIGIPLGLWLRRTGALRPPAPPRRRSWPRAAWGMRRRCSSCCRLSSRCRSEARARRTASMTGRRSASAAAVRASTAAGSTMPTRPMMRSSRRPGGCCSAARRRLRTSRRSSARAAAILTASLRRSIGAGEHALPPPLPRAAAGEPRAAV